MRTRTKFPRWLKRRGYSTRLKRDLLAFMRARRAEMARDRVAGDAEARTSGTVIVLEHYRTLRVIVRLG